MIKSFTAVTREIDDPKSAAAEILDALDIEKNLLKNSLGIISCFSEFEETGVLREVCEALPFDCIGATTCLCAAGGEVDQVILGITVLTSDDCSFTTVVSPIAEDYEDSIADALNPMLAEKGKPALFLSYFPLINNISGDMILAAIDKATGGIPLFGTTAVDHLMDYSTAKTICNGKALRESVVLGAIYGNPEFTFEIASLEDDKIRRQRAIVTKSNGNILMGVNGKTALEYLKEIGLTEAELATGLGVTPLVVDYKNGAKPVARAVFALTPEGHAVCGGAMPVNATIGVGHIDPEDILHTTAQTLKPLLDKESAILSYSCIARYLVMELENKAEAEKVSRLSGDNNHLFACSGGEICPLPDANGNLKNFYHNYTIVFCRVK